ncbi:MAG: CHRD domain-containing protein [Acidimicrobiia bacterium]
MRSSIIARALLACSLLFFAGCGDDDDDGAVSTGSSNTESPTIPPTTAPAAGSDGSEGPSSDDPYEAQLMLSGLAEVPGPGSAGMASAGITYDGDELCFAFETDGVGAVTAGHIHVGAANVAGPVVVNFQLTTSEDGPVDERCLPDDEKIAGVFADPGAHYVNLHTAEFPDGAVRAQLPGR